ncbi:hypothetical protein [Cellulomonas aerilata]|uniref:Uncharacterized protein n=1 Tax=Cellulomonas aerilata TaxID=515326 RepID=A0A512DD13_9CELL|nr:hypothetical protein [Cellulomonas aerilata]GEO34358.1 hypothetical protein CAE01nite_20830 [Cellulomonas aerilata]
MALAANPQTPADVLARFAQYAYADGNRAIAVSNPSFPELAFLDLAGRTTIDSRLLRAAAGKGSSKVREAVAANTATPSDVLAALAGDPNPGGGKRLVTKPSTPPEALVELIDRSEDE